MRNVLNGGTYVGQDLLCVLHLDHINTLMWHPSTSSDPFHISLVHCLKRDYQKATDINTNERYTFCQYICSDIVVLLHHSGGRMPSWPGLHRWSPAGRSSCAGVSCS